MQAEWENNLSVHRAFEIDQIVRAARTAGGSPRLLTWLMSVCFVRVKCTLIPSAVYHLAASKSVLAGEIHEGKAAGTCSRDKEDIDLGYRRRRLRQH